MVRDEGPFSLIQPWVSHLRIQSFFLNICLSDESLMIINKYINITWKKSFIEQHNLGVSKMNHKVARNRDEN